MSRRGKGRAAAVDDSVAGIKRNDKGGILVDDTELKAAFEFFDVNSTGKITLSDLKVIQRNATRKHKTEVHAHARGSIPQGGKRCSFRSQRA